MKNFLFWHLLWGVFGVFLSLSLTHFPRRDYPKLITHHPIVRAAVSLTHSDNCMRKRRQSKGRSVSYLATLSLPHFLSLSLSFLSFLLLFPRPWLSIFNFPCSSEEKSILFAFLSLLACPHRRGILEGPALNHLVVANVKYFHWLPTVQHFFCTYKELFPLR